MTPRFNKNIFKKLGVWERAASVFPAPVSSLSINSNTLSSWILGLTDLSPDFRQAPHWARGDLGNCMFTNEGVLGMLWKETHVLYSRWGHRYPSYKPHPPKGCPPPRCRRQAISLVESPHLARSHQSWVHHIHTTFQIFPVQEDIILCKHTVLILYCCETNYPLPQCFKTTPTTDGLTGHWGCLGSAGQLFCSACCQMGWDIPDDSLTGLAVHAGCRLGTHWGRG